MSHCPSKSVIIRPTGHRIYPATSEAIYYSRRVCLSSNQGCVISRYTSSRRTAPQVALLGDGPESPDKSIIEIIRRAPHSGRYSDSEERNVLPSGGKKGYREGTGLGTLEAHLARTIRSPAALLFNSRFRRQCDYPGGISTQRDRGRSNRNDPDAQAHEANGSACPRLPPRYTPHSCTHLTCSVVHIRPPVRHLRAWHDAQETRRSAHPRNVTDQDDDNKDEREEEDLMPAETDEEALDIELNAEARLW
ncbi:hypothetical protein DFH94DRAFT_807629 [Russula ochroleuca]|uniref:Uncharacterized protein n=1 Tax=Russula ochroleuca TaxID=152965 RepID=A0A9P5TCR6_9AGAM|nr:hypothetical protein DFH94DRAFT_807629 [Russula ochroleuca]